MQSVSSLQQPKIYQFQEINARKLAAHTTICCQPVSPSASQHHTELRKMQQQRESISGHKGNNGYGVIQQLHAAAVNQHIANSRHLNAISSLRRTKFTKHYVGLVLKIIMSHAVSQLTAATKIVPIPRKYIGVS